MGACACMTESLCCSPETVLTDCIPVQNKEEKKKSHKGGEGPVSAKSCCVTLNNLIKPSEIQFPPLHTSATNHADLC